MKFSTTNRELRRVLSLLKPITDNAEGLPILMAVFFEVREGVVTATATDRYRIVFTSVETVPWDSLPMRDGEALVDATMLYRALRTSTVNKSRMDDMVHVYVTESGRLALQLVGPNIEVTLPLTEGDYPKVWELASRFGTDEPVKASPVDPSYARDLLPDRPHGRSQIASSVGERGYFVVATDNVYGVLVPLNPRGEDVTLRVPQFVTDRIKAAKA